MHLQILMIDDDPDEILVSRYLLERRSDDIELVAYTDPNDAIEELRRRIDAREAGPALVTIDIHMPLHHGIELAGVIKPLCDQLGSDVGVLTGSINPDDEAAAYAADVRFFAVKPFNADVLESIGAELGSFEVRREGRRLSIVPPGHGAAETVERAP